MMSTVFVECIPLRNIGECILWMSNVGDRE